MILLYHDTWRAAPPPVGYPGCAIVKVSSACTAGDQAEVRASIPRTTILADILKRRRRLLKRAFRYASSIGAVRTLAKIRSNVLAYENQLLDTMAAVSGVLEDAPRDLPFGKRDVVAGYRHGHPLYADALVMHPDQLVAVPEGVSAQDAATVIYYSLALEGLLRISRDVPEAEPVLILGDGLHCRLLARMLADAGRAAESPGSPEGREKERVRAFRKSGGAVVVGAQRWFETANHPERPRRVFFMGLSPNRLQAEEWALLRNAWIGLPHPSLHNTNILSGLPLDLPACMSGAGMAEAFLDMRSRSWRPASFLTPLSVAAARAGDTVSLGTAFQFTADPRPESVAPAFVERKRPSPPNRAALRVGVAGLGLWARGNLIPLLIKDPRVRLVAGADHDPVRLQQAADLFGFPFLFSDPLALCRSDHVDAVFITTWHDTHAELAAAAIDAGKPVFVEKPPALDGEHLRLLAAALTRRPGAFLAVGYNRPHSAVTRLLKAELAKASGPVTITAIVREPTIPKTHYYYWPQQGTRVASNSCHWIDYAFHLLLPRIPSDIRAVPALAIDGQDNNVVVLRYADGSLASLTFANRGESLINGDEYIDVKIAGVQYMIRDFMSCLRYRDGSVREIWRSKADRGWAQEIKDVLDGMIERRPPRDHREILTSAALVVEARMSYERGGELRHVSGDSLERQYAPGVPGRSGDRHPIGTSAGTSAPANRAGEP